MLCKCIHLSQPHHWLSQTPRGPTNVAGQPQNPEVFNRPLSGTPTAKFGTSSWPKVARGMKRFLRTRRDRYTPKLITSTAVVIIA